MNATVNWIKRRVSLSSPSSSPILIHQTPATSSNDKFLSSNDDIITSRSSSNESTRSTPLGSNGISRPPSTGGGSSVHNCGTRLMQHDIIDPSSPLSILAATSKLTTFPYGELQALNARMSREAVRQKVGPNNAVQHQANQIRHPTIPNPSNSATGAGLKPKTRLKDNKPPIKPAPGVKTLSPSVIPSPPPPTPPLATSAKLTAVNPTMLPTSLAPLPRIRGATHNQRSASATLVPAPRPSTISHKKSASLSSTQNTRSKRQKTAHVIPSINLPDLPSFPRPIATPSQPHVSAETSIPSETGKKRVLPVRHGHSDILDGEISLLSTPQRLDSTLPAHLI
jgi:hypothetical protein